LYRIVNAKVGKRPPQNQKRGSGRHCS